MSVNTKRTNVRLFRTRQAIRGLAVRLLSPVAPHWAARELETLFLTPARLASPPREAPWAERLTWRDVATATGPQVVGEIGGGPTVLLVHGWEGRSLQMAPLAASLAEAGFRALTVDLPAHGTSPERRLTLPGAARSLRALADALGPIHGVVAHSFGSSATTLALAEGLETDGVVYIAPPLDPGAFLFDLCRRLGIPRRVAELMIERLEARLDFSWPRILPRSLAPARSEDLLILHDPEDRQVAFDEARELSRLWPAARLQEIQGVGHNRILGHGATRAATARFFSDRARSAA